MGLPRCSITSSKVCFIFLQPQITTWLNSKLRISKNEWFSSHAVVDPDFTHKIYGISEVQWLFILNSASEGGMKCFWKLESIPDEVLLSTNVEQNMSGLRKTRGMPMWTYSRLFYHMDYSSGQKRIGYRYTASANERRASWFHVSLMPVSVK